MTIGGTSIPIRNGINGSEKEKVLNRADEVEDVRIIEAFQYLSPRSY
jgi:hypothetical protein